MKAGKGTVAAAVALGIAVLWTAFGRQFVFEAAYPAENGANLFVRKIWLPLKDAFLKPSLASENRRLADEIARLRMRLSDYASLAAENASLRKALDFDRRVSPDWIAAPVLSRGGTLGAGGMIRIGKGTSAGVRRGAAVVVPEGIVGRVEETSLHTATVRLASDPAVQVACETVASAAGERPVSAGILRGGRLLHIRRDADLRAGVKIATSGLGGVYPRGIAVGTLSEDAHDGDLLLEKEGRVRLAVDFESLDNVFVRRED